jgi:hypothetical protein
MSTLTFDTHEFVKKLKEAGFSEAQAETLTDLQKITVSNTLEQAKHDYHLDDLATKRDLNEGQLKLQKEIAETKANLVKWLVAVGLLQITIITGLLLRLSGKV